MQLVKTKREKSTELKSPLLFIKEQTVDNVTVFQGMVFRRQYATKKIVLHLNALVDFRELREIVAVCSVIRDGRVRNLFTIRIM